MSSGDFSIGSTVWPGTSKLVEEIGEVQQVLGALQQVLGKLLQCPDGKHWDGDLRTKLIEEIGDVHAALVFFTKTNLSIDEIRAIHERSERKLALFNQWQAEQSEA